MTYSRFLELFPDNDTCLEYLKERFFSDGTECPKCGRASKFHRIKGRSAYSCQFCGHHVYPTAGTIFHKSTVNLQLWFYAIYLMSSTRCGISAKQLEREIGVTYKTAHRMFKQIRKLMSDDDPSLLRGYSVYVKAGKYFASHSRIKHETRIYVQGRVHTQTIEGFFGLFKNGIRGVYHSASVEYLQNYLDEYAFRYNRRHSAQPMFYAILDRVQKLVAA